MAAAARVDGGPLAAGEYAWTFNEELAAGPVDSHGSISHVFNNAGNYAITLTVTLAGTVAPLACINTQTGTFTGMATAQPVISGQVRDKDGAGISGVTLVGRYPGDSVVTNSKGAYEIAVPWKWSDYIRPEHRDYEFTPTYLDYADVTSSVTDQDYVAEAPVPPQQPSPDCNGNGIVDSRDITAGTSEDCNDNGAPDECDLANGASQDCNSNGVLDECDLANGTSDDCNGNGMPDECDTASGSSEDCNSNSIPDECESDCNANGVPDICEIAVEHGGFCTGGIPPCLADENGNGVPDECEVDCNNNGIDDYQDIADCTSADCNGNLIPDECDIASGRSPDVNGDGVPDECDNFIYVDDNGDEQPCYDSSQPLGSYRNPYDTIQAAANVVGPGDTVFVKAGRYPEQVDITASGTASDRITFKNYANDLVVVDAENIRQHALFVGNFHAPGSGDYVTIDGFTCKNMTVFNGYASGILVTGTNSVIIRNCHIFNDVWDGTITVRGIYVIGPNQDTVVEYNHIHDLFGGINTRIDTGGTFPGVPERPIIRWNHVHHFNMVDEELQNHATGIAISNGSLEALVEHNVVHHCDDGGIVTNASIGHVIRYNIAYLIDHLDTPGGNGPGIKTHPTNATGPDPDVVHHNVSFLNQASGFEINVHFPQLGAKVYHNTSYGNGARGFTVSKDLVNPLVNSDLKNNIAAGNVGYDIKHLPPDPGLLEYCLQEDGWNTSGGPHMRSGSPVFQNFDDLAIDSNGDGTPDLFDDLSDPAIYPGAEAAILFAKQQVAWVFTPQPGLLHEVDAGIDLGLGFVDLLGNGPVDDPSSPNPWSGEPGTGLYDMGAIEYIPPP